MIPYLTGKGSETIVDALIDEPTAWHQSPGGSLYYGDTEQTFVSIGDPRAPAAVSFENAWKLVIELGGDEAVQTLIFVMAQCLGAENQLEKVRIHVNDSLEFRGLRRHRKRDFRPEQKREEARRFRILSDIWVSVRDTIEIGTGRGKRKKPIHVISRLIEIAVESEDEGSAQGRGAPLPLPSIVSGEGRDIPYAVRVKMGDWVRPYTEATPPAVRQMLQKVIQYDVATEAQRIALRFSLAMFFGRVHGTITVGELLQSSRLTSPTRRADVFKDAVEEALELLTRDGLIGGWRYAEGDEVLPHTRWVGRWLKWTIVFSSASAIGAFALG